MTENAIDFRKLVAKQELHPGLILLPSVSRDLSHRLLVDAISYLASLGTPSDVIVNHVLDVTEAGAFALLPLSK